MLSKTERITRLQEMHAAMLKVQTEGGDFDLTFRELMTIWKCASTSVVKYYLSKMTDKGMVKYKTHGRCRSYRALESKTSHSARVQDVSQDRVTSLA